MSWNWYEGGLCRWSTVRNGEGNCPFSSSPGNIRVVTRISCFLRLTGLLSLSILPACAFAEAVNVLMLYHYCQMSIVPYQCNSEGAIIFKADFPVAAVVCYTAGLCIYLCRSYISLWLKFKKTGKGKEMQFKPRDLFLPGYQAVECN